MRLTPQVLSAVGFSPWMIPGPLLISAGVSLDLEFSSNANLTAAVQYTYDDPAQDQVPVTYARAGTVLTVTYPGHLLNANDTCDLASFLGIAGIPIPGVAGAAQQQNFTVASITDQNNFTVTVANAGIAADTGLARIYRLFTHPTVLGTGTPPARIDGFLNYPAAAFRLAVTAWTAGSARLGAQTTKGV